MSTENNQLVPFQDMERMARAIAASGFFGVKTPEQAVALMLIAQAEGMHPAAAARDFHVIDGRPSLKADAMLARFQNAGGKVQWDELTDKRVSATFSHPSGGQITIDWDMARAKQAGLGMKSNWNKYPRQMLRARVISEGIRTVYPGVLSGMYTPEEVSDLDDRPARTAQSAPQPAPKPDQKKESEQEIEEAHVIEETKEQTPANPANEKINAATWTGLCKSAMSCNNTEGKPLGVSNMFERAKKVFGVKLGTDLTLSQVETIENVWLLEWQQGNWKDAA